MLSIAEMIQARARELGQTDETIARQLDVSSSTVTRWRQGKIVKVGSNKVPALADWLGVSEADVVLALHSGFGPTLGTLAAELDELSALVQSLGQQGSEILGRLNQLDRRVTALEPAGSAPGGGGRQSSARSKRGNESPSG